MTLCVKSFYNTSQTVSTVLSKKKLHQNYDNINNYAEFGIYWQEVIHKNVAESAPFAAAAGAKKACGWAATGACGRVIHKVVHIADCVTPRMRRRAGVYRVQQPPAAKCRGRPDK